MGEKSHGSQSYISLAQLTDGGESYCTTLDNISLERRLDFHVADHAKEITRKDAIKKIGNYSKYAALCALGTYLVLNPQKAQASSPEAPGSEF